MTSSLSRPICKGQIFIILSYFLEWEFNESLVGDKRVRGCDKKAINCPDTTRELSVVLLSVLRRTFRLSNLINPSALITCWREGAEATIKAITPAECLSLFEQGWAVISSENMSQISNGFWDHHHHYFSWILEGSSCRRWTVSSIGSWHNIIYL